MIHSPLNAHDLRFKEDDLRFKDDDLRFRNDDLGRVFGNQGFQNILQSKYILRKFAEMIDVTETFYIFAAPKN